MRETTDKVFETKKKFVNLVERNSLNGKKFF